MLGDEEKAFGVPRRFGMATILVLTLAYAVLLAAMNVLVSTSLGGRRELAVGVVLFVTAIGACQMLMHRGTRPRSASIQAGCLLGLAIGLFGPFIASFFSPIMIGEVVAAAVCAAPFGFVFGGLMGYVAGGLVAGVFLIMDGVDRALYGDRNARGVTAASVAEGESGEKVEPAQGEPAASEATVTSANEPGGATDGTRE
jgi:hypothetical protein